jgi:peptidoglycan pentaglycine glycine transferase (the first glycine)
MNGPDWNAAIASLPNAHLLQTWEWSQIKSEAGWQAIPCIWEMDGSLRDSRNLSGVQPGAAAMVLQRTILVKGIETSLRIQYVPKGPLLDWSNTALRRRVLNDLSAIAHKSGAIFIKIDPNVPLGLGIVGEPGGQDKPVGQEVLHDMKSYGWVFSPDQIQFRNTVWVDLASPEEDILRRMKQKTRYNIHLAERKGVRIRPGDEADFSLLYRMYAETSIRDGFVIRDENYYGRVWKTFLDNLREKREISLPAAQPLIAEIEGEGVAAIVPVRFAKTAWYLYGMSRELHREKMPSYLLQWEAMRWAKRSGCLVYDLWGAPDEFDEKDSMWGVFRFKEGLGGQVVRTIGAWDLPLRPLFYRIYTRALPWILGLMRRQGNQRTRHMLAG